MGMQPRVGKWAATQKLHTLILDQRLLSKLQKNSKIYIRLKEAIVQSNDEYSVDEYI